MRMEALAKKITHRERKRERGKRGRGIDGRGREKEELKRK